MGFSKMRGPRFARPHNKKYYPLESVLEDPLFIKVESVGHRHSLGNDLRRP